MSLTINFCKKLNHLGLALLLTATALSATGCSTTHEFKPTASVIVGAHKSL
ncbi:hypothetical protein [Psychrobacter sp. BF1]|uniref:hypothetical protein n=1 Tax=Psychrobacter sp. BF1 TaxID=2821147 RepID=UPI001C4E233E|nr:hypothetical protein [Psychrobacter sp. BF1]